MNPLRHAYHATLDTLFPHQCYATSTPIHRHDLGLAQPARLHIAHALNWPYCTRCGATAGQFTDHRRYRPCPRCPHRNLGTSAIVRVGTFAPPLSPLILQLKFAKQWPLARTLAPFLHQAITLHQTKNHIKVDALLPVPLHWRRRLSRGFNQSEELARELSRLTAWPVRSALRRIRPTTPQTATQSRTQRDENLKNAFTCSPRQNFAGQTVWLIDDVCTTGATLHAAAAALKRLPPKQQPAAIFAAVLCVTDLTPVPPSPDSAQKESGPELTVPGRPF